MADKSIAALLQQAMADAERIARDEVRLAVLGAKEQGGRAARGAALLAAAAVAAGLGVGCLAVAALIGLSDVIDRAWFAGIIVAAALLGVALLVVAPGFRGLVVERMRDVPINTAQSVREDVDAVRRAVRH